MYLTKVLLRTKLPQNAPEVFSYFTSKKIAKRGIVLVPFKNRLVYGVVLEQKEVISQKQEIKKGGVLLKPIKKIVFPFPFLKEFQINLGFSLARFYLTHPSRFLYLFLPEAILKKIKDFQRIPLEVFLPFKKSSKEKLYIAPNYFFPEKEIKIHQKSGGQILFIFPTKNQIKFWKKQFLSLGFKENQIVFFSPKLASKKIFDVFQKVLLGKAKVVLGQRSALFLPFSNLSLICLLDAENKSYFSPKEPYFDAKIVAKKLSELSGADLVFTTPFSSLESYLEFKEKEEIKVPQIEWEIFDLKYLKTPLNQKFQERIKKEAEAGKKVLVFIRKRESGVIFCPDCKWIKRCLKCFLPMKVKEGKRGLEVICPKCKLKESLPQKCEICSNWELKIIGGKERDLEKELKREFPRNRLFVLEGVQSLNKFFKIGKVLISGAKIFEFLPFLKKEKIDVTFVFNLDPLLNLPHFNVEERVFEIIQKLTSLTKEKIIIQTNFKELFETFFLNKGLLYEKWKKEREKTNYPPFKELVFVEIFEKNKERAKKLGLELKKTLQNWQKQFKFEILGPKPIRSTFKGYLLEFLLKIDPKDDLLKERLKAILPPKAKIKVNPKEI
jgi:primosomal protein N'